MTDVVTEITKKRGSVYGPFLHNAIVAQAIKAALRNIPDPNNEGMRWENLPLDVREGLDLIALKMSRIVTGDPEYLDNWDDIGGYAKIVADRIRAANSKTGIESGNIKTEIASGFPDMNRSVSGFPGTNGSD